MLAEDGHSGVTTALVAGTNVVHFTPGTGEFRIYTGSTTFEERDEERC